MHDLIKMLISFHVLLNVFRRSALCVSSHLMSENTSLFASATFLRGIVSVTDSKMDPSLLVRFLLHLWGNLFHCVFMYPGTKFILDQRYSNSGQWWQPYPIEGEYLVSMLSRRLLIHFCLWWLSSITTIRIQQRRSRRLLKRISFPRHTERMERSLCWMDSRLFTRVPLIFTFMSWDLPTKTV